MSFSDRKKTILNSLGFFWTEVFLDDDFVNSYSKTLAIQYNDLDTIVANTPGVKSREDIPVFEARRSGATRAPCRQGRGECR